MTTPADTWPSGERVIHTDDSGRTLRLAPPPPINLVKHDPRASVAAFLQAAPPQAGRGDTNLDEAIAQEHWYHTIELGNGRVTDGRFDHRPLVPHYGLPADLSGARVLDVGTADGFWAFELERRGASEVVALEVPQLSDRDFPRRARELVRAESDTPPGRRFELARRALGSNVQLVRHAIYDIDPARLGRFDFVHVGDVLLHVRDPAGALEAICSVTAGSAHIADSVSPIGAPDDDRNLSAYYGGWDMTTWWTPAPQTLAQMTLDAGFESVEILGLYRLDMRGGHGAWRAVLRALGG